MNEHDTTDDTRWTSTDEEITAVEALGAKLSEDFAIIANRMQRDMDALAIIHSGMQRCVRRMEVLRQTVRPLPPIDPKTGDNRLCAGERAIVSVLKRFWSAQTVTLMTITGYASSSLRTWIPMLREKGIVEAWEGGVKLANEIPEKYRAIVDAIPAHQDL